MDVFQFFAQQNRELQRLPAQGDTAKLCNRASHFFKSLQTVK